MSTYKPNAAEAAWIRELAAILDETGLTEVEIQKADFRVRVSRGGGSIAYAAPAAAPAPMAPAAPRPKADVPAAAAPDRSKGVPSPMVGTVYLSPAPGANPFVKVGDSVAAGQTLMIIEAMKTMNPIPAPRAGVVREILVRDAQPVEYGEALVIVD
jgi:acetyl-CoA carboxylase biotin carboxyl carrier protein